MTDRAEIERLLNQTGRTLEGLPTQDDYWYSDDYVDRNEEIGMMMYRSGFIRNEPYIMHQSDVIELLVGALRDALDKQPKWISVEEELPMVGQLVLTYLGGYTGDAMELCSLDEFGGWVTDMRIAEDAPITHWMPLPEPPMEKEQDVGA